MFLNLGSFYNLLVFVSSNCLKLLLFSDLLALLYAFRIVSRVYQVFKICFFPVAIFYLICLVVFEGIGCCGKISVVKSVV